MAVRELNKVLNWLGVSVFAAMGSPKVQGIQADRERYFCLRRTVCVCLSPAFWWFVLTKSSQPTGRLSGRGESCALRARHSASGFFFLEMVRILE